MFSYSFSPSFKRMPRRLMCLGSAAAGIVLTALPVTAAQAAVVSTGACDSSVLTQPFLKWGDSNVYKLAPGGDFEGSLSTWALRGGAQKAAESESYGVTGALGKSSLALPAGASAQSPFSCVNASYPTFRFFARGMKSGSSVRASVVYQTPFGLVSVAVGVVNESGTWQPTPTMLTGSIVAGALSNGTAQMALRFTGLTGSSRIDDVFIDPRMR